MAPSRRAPADGPAPAAATPDTVYAGYAPRAQVRFRAAAEGAFERFWLEAISFRCDAEPVSRAGYADALASLTR